MDITHLNTSKAAGEGAWMQLSDPITGEKLPVSIELYGSDSDVFRNKKREISNRRIGSKEQLSIAKIESDGIELLASCVKSWGALKINGETPSDAEKVLTEFAWIREQVDQFVGERANFLKKPASC